jgi:biotin synthase
VTDRRMARLGKQELLGWLREEDPTRLAELHRRADQVRHFTVGDAVHLRGLIELSNHCDRSCGYCGLRVGNRELDRYRMSEEEIVSCARKARDFGYGTVVLQSGEDLALSAEWVGGVVRRIKGETGLAVTLSLGERSESDLAHWKEAGANRYLLRFETSDRELFDLIHPPRSRVPSDRIGLLRKLGQLGYEAGGGVMVGIPGQTYDTLAEDLLMFEALDLDMVGIGPYLPHPATPLGRGEWVRPTAAEEQVPNTEQMTYKMVSLARLVCPEANIPSTTAIATLNRESGRELALSCGANVVMPNLTPLEYRTRYEVYPGKACVHETADVCHKCLVRRLAAIGRKPGQGPGGRSRHS